MFKRRSRPQRPNGVKKPGIFSWKLLKKLGIFLLVVGTLVLLWLFFTRVKTDFTVKLDDLGCADENRVKQALEKENIKFYWLQSQEIEKKLRQQFPCINESRI